MNDGGTIYARNLRRHDDDLEAKLGNIYDEPNEISLRLGR
jgi:hypothetical protein